MSSAQPAGFVSSTDAMSHLMSPVTFCRLHSLVFVRLKQSVMHAIIGFGCPVSLVAAPQPSLGCHALLACPSRPCAVQSSANQGALFTEAGKDAVLCLHGPCDAMSQALMYDAGADCTGFGIPGFFQFYHLTSGPTFQRAAEQELEKFARRHTSSG